MGASQGMAGDGDNLYIADRWNNVIRKVDLKAGRVSTIAGGAARGQAGFVQGGHTIDGPAMVAHFHSGGGPCSIVRCPSTGAFYMNIADERYARVLHHDHVWTFGLLKPPRDVRLAGPMAEVTGKGTTVLGVDHQGRVYVGEDGIVRRFYRREVFASGISPPKKPNPLELVLRHTHKIDRWRTLQANENRLDVVSDGPVLASGTPFIPVSNGRTQVQGAVAAGFDGFLLVWQQETPLGGESSTIVLCFLSKDGKVVKAIEGAGSGMWESPHVASNPRTGDFLVVWQAHNDKELNSDIRARLVRPSDFDKTEVDGPTHTVANGSAHQIRPAVASDGNGYLIVWSELFACAPTGPAYVLRGRLLDTMGKPKGEPFNVEPRGIHPAVAFDGRDYVVAFERSGQVYVWRLSSDGSPVGERIKPGGVFAHAPAVAANGQVAVVTASCRPLPNPWGWNGPSAFNMGRIMRDGRTPERFRFNYDQLADGGFAGLLDQAQWKDQRGWPAGRPGGFRTTANGYWPHLYSSVTWDGTSWVAVWVRAKLDGMNLVDHDLFACRMDPETMMPTSEPVLVAGGDAEPGSQTKPALVALDKGRSLLVYQQVDEDGQSRVAMRVLDGGATCGPARVEVRASP